MRSMQYW